MKSTRLPDAEFAVMEIIWELPAPVTIGQVREKLSEEKAGNCKRSSRSLGG